MLVQLLDQFVSYFKEEIDGDCVEWKVGALQNIKPAEQPSLYE